jgi:hypothetical protein
MSRTTVTLLTALAALALATPGASAKSKHHCPKGKKAVGHRCVTVKKKKPVKPKPPVVPTTPIRADVLPGSTASITYGDATRTAALTGRIDGGIPGGYMLNRDNTMKFTTGTIGIGATDLLTDACTGPQPAALDPVTVSRLDAAKPSTALITRTGAVIAKANVVLRAVLDLRGSACDAPVTQSGYAETPLTLTLRGQIEKGTGLTALALDGDPLTTNVAICTAAGVAAQPCPSAPTMLPVTLGVHIIVKVAIGG